MEEVGPLEIRNEDITIEKKHEEGRDGRFSREIYIVEIRNQVIEITSSSAEDTIAQWIRGVHRLHRLRKAAGGGGSGGAPLVAGLSFCRREEDRYFHPAKGPSRDNLPIALICVYVGGSHCLVSDVERHAVQPISRVLKTFLADQHITFVGVGIKKVSEQLKGLGVHVSSPTELRLLVEKAFGRETMSGLKGLEEMAHVALGGMKVSKKPPNFASNILGSYSPVSKELMFATRDAFLAYRIGVSCLERINALT